MKWWGYLFIGLLGLKLSGARAQTPGQPAAMRWGSAVSTSLSYTGLAVAAGVSLQQNNWQVIMGPRLRLTDSYRLAAGPWGVAAAIYYFTTFSGNRRWQGFANADYQNNFQKGYCPAGDCGHRRQLTHEFSLGYGLQYQSAPRWAIYNAINLGLYRESLPNRYRADNLQVQGLNMLVKLGLRYYLKDEY